MKKKLSLILAVITLVTTVFSSNVFAAFTDVADDNPYREAITTLTKLGIINGYEDNTFKPDGAITRAEFAKIITCAMGYQTIETDGNYFTDVSEHWGKNYINVCAGLNIIAGMGDGTFAPDLPVTYEQALKMVVCTLGYGSFAENEGGWPEGYHIQASTLDLIDGISGTAYTDNAPRGVVAQIVFNALEVCMAEFDNMTMSSKKGEKTLLNDYLKVKKLKGILVGVEDYTTEDCTMQLGNDMMDVLDVGNGVEYLIDYSTYTQDVTEINSYLGKTITVYYRQLRANDDRTLVIIDDESTKNEVIEVLSGDIYNISGSQFTYYTNTNSTKTLKVDTSEISTRYNGKLVSKTDSIILSNGTSTKTVGFEDAIKEWLSPDSEYFIYGSVKITDSGADGEIDLIEIYDYETLVALKKPTSSDYRLQDKLKTANYLILNPDSSDYSYTLIRDGKSVEVTAVSANDVILYAKSLDGKLYTMYATSKPVTGTVDSIMGNFESIEISGTEYEIGSSCLSYIESEGRTLAIGSTGAFYVDMYGTIVFATIEEEETIPYAYILSAGIDPATETGYISAYAPQKSSSSAKTYYMNSKVKVNNITMGAYEVVSTLTSAAASSNKDADIASQIYGSKTPTFDSLSQLVKMEIDSSGKVSEIITLSEDKSDGEGNVTQGVINEDPSKLVRYRSIGKYYYAANNFRESSTSSTPVFTTDSSTTVLYIPMNRSDKDDYSKKTVSSAFSTSESYFVEAYDVNEEKVAGLVVLYGSDGKLTPVSRTTDFSIVAKVPNAYYDSSSGVTTQKLSVFKGATVTPTDWTTYDSTEFADACVGDVIQFAYDNDKLAQGRVDNIKFADIARVLDDSDASVLYDWTEEQTPDATNNYQSYVFDYRFKSVGSDKLPKWDETTGSYKDETYTTTTLGTIPYLRAYMANVSQVLVDAKKLYVTKNGFTRDANGEWKLDDSEYEEVAISSTTKIIRMDDSRKELSRYVDGTETDLAYTDIRDAKNYGTDCAKILVCSLRGTAKLIVIYE